MTINDIIKTYHIKLDDFDKNIINSDVAKKGIEEYLTQQLIYLDCTRIVNNTRMMQTIGYPYKREISKYLYALNNWSATITCPEDYDKNPDDYWLEKLLERHNINIEYEKDNPPVLYEKSKGATKRKSKVKQRNLFPEETKKAKVSKAESKLKSKLLGANIGFSSFKLKTN